AAGAALSALSLHDRSSDLGEQVAVPAPGPDRAAVEEDDLVGVLQDERGGGEDDGGASTAVGRQPLGDPCLGVCVDGAGRLDEDEDRKSTRLNSSHVKISYA